VRECLVDALKTDGQCRRRMVESNDVTFSEGAREVVANLSLPSHRVVNRAIRPVKALVLERVALGNEGCEPADYVLPLRLSRLLLGVKCSLVGAGQGRISGSDGVACRAELNPQRIELRI